MSIQRAENLDPLMIEARQGNRGHEAPDQSAGTKTSNKPQTGGLGAEAFESD